VPSNGVSNLRLNGFEGSIDMGAWLTSTGCEFAELLQHESKGVPDRLVAIAERNKLGARLAHSKVRTPQVPERWTELHDENHRRISRLFDEADAVAATASIPVVLLENGMVIRSGYGCRGCWTFGDLDLLVRKQDRDAIAIHFEKRGYIRTELSGDRVILERTEPDRTALRFNVQSDLVARRWIPPLGGLSPENVIADSFPLSNSALRRPASEHALLQLLIHTASHTFVRTPGLRLYADLDAFVRGERIDWSRAQAAIRGSRLQHVAFVALSLARDLFGSPVPPAVLSSLTPSLPRTIITTAATRRSRFVETPEGPHPAAAAVLFFLTTAPSDIAAAVVPPRDWLIRAFAANEQRSTLALHFMRVISMVRRGHEGSPH
jgi:hypothetical protein